MFPYVQYVPKDFNIFHSQFQKLVVGARRLHSLTMRLHSGCLRDRIPREIFFIKKKTGSRGEEVTFMDNEVALIG